MTKKTIKYALAKKIHGVENYWSDLAMYGDATNPLNVDLNQNPHFSPDIEDAKLYHEMKPELLSRGVIWILVEEMTTVTRKLV